MIKEDDAEGFYWAAKAEAASARAAAAEEEEMKKYKITDENMCSHNGCTWEIGVEKFVSMPGNKLCSEEVFHFYDSPALAVLMNPIHGEYAAGYRLWEIECDEVAHDGLKGGSKKQTLLREIPVPQITSLQKARFAILCTNAVRQSEAWRARAEAWLRNPSPASARAAAAEAVWGAPEASVWAARATLAWAAVEARAAEAAEAAEKVAAEKKASVRAAREALAWAAAVASARAAAEARAEEEEEAEAIDFAKIAEEALEGGK